MVKKSPGGFMYGNASFSEHPFKVLFKGQLNGFINNIWIISLTSDQYYGAARFNRLVDYAKKFKVAVKYTGLTASFIGQRYLSDDEYSSLYNQVVEQEQQTVGLIENSDDDDDFDGSDL